MKVITLIREALSLLETQGGITATLIGLILYGTWVYFHKESAGSTIVNMAFGALIKGLVIKDKPTA